MPRQHNSPMMTEAKAGFSVRMMLGNQGRKKRFRRWNAAAGPSGPALPMDERDRTFGRVLLSICAKLFLQSVEGRSARNDRYGMRRHGREQVGPRNQVSRPLQNSTGLRPGD